jgi:tRNA A-37 threonylcarbamoyl transferase component Bud32
VTAEPLSLSTRRRRVEPTPGASALIEPRGALPANCRVDGGGDVRRLGAGGIQWELHAAADTLFDDHGWKWDAWQRAEALSIVKTGAHRTVYRLALPTGVFYIKHCKTPGLRAIALNVLRPCPAVLEWRAAEAAREAGIPTFETLALGRTFRAGLVRDNYLITREIPDSQPLFDFVNETFPRLPAARQARLRRRLMLAAGELAARLHAAGFVHHDFHAGNMLVRVEPDDRVRLWIIDLAAMRRGRPPALAAIKRNFTLLSQYFIGRTSSSDRLRFLHAYCATRRRLSDNSTTSRDRSQPGASPLGELTGDFVREMEQAGRRAAARHWRRADRRFRMGNRQILKHREGRTHGRALAGLGLPLLRELCREPEGLFERRLQFWCKQTHKRRVAAVAVPFKGDETLSYWKRAELKSIWGRLLGWLERAPVRRAWEIGHALLRRGIETPRPLAYVETREPGMLRQYLLTEGIADSATLDQFLKQDYAQLTSCARLHWKRGLAKRLAGQVRRMHEFGFDHRDLKATNILVSRNANVRRTWLLDLDSVRRWAWMPPVRRIQNLARLNVTTLPRPAFQHTDRLRFLLTYLDTRDKPAWKSAWRQIARRARQKIAKNQKNGRPLT